MAEPDLAGVAGVEAVTLMLDKSTPPRLVARVTGYLGDACTRLGAIEQTLADKTIKVNIGTLRPAGKMCAQVIKDFEQEVALNTAGLALGDYTVEINGVSKAFKVDAGGAKPAP